MDISLITLKWIKRGTNYYECKWKDMIISSSGEDIYKTHFSINGKEVFTGTQDEFKQLLIDNYCQPKFEQ